MAEAGSALDVGAGLAVVDLEVDRGFDLGVGVDLDFEVVADFDLDVAAFVLEPDAGSGFELS